MATKIWDKIVRKCIGRPIRESVSHKNASLTKEEINNYNKSRKSTSKSILCFAPYTSLYFGINGNIGVCCYNRVHILGTYPETSIIEAWQGSKRLDLISKIKNFDLTSGCQACLMQWKEKAYQSVLAKNFDEFPYSSEYPVTVEFELSNKCNYECVMCSGEFSSLIQQNRENSQLLPLIYDDKFVEELLPFIPHIKKAKFLGGEPFVIPIYYKIWEAFIRINPKCVLVVQSNGSILNNKIKDLLNQGNFHLSISIDSINKKTYEIIRKNGNFESVFENLLYFIDYCKKHKRYIGISTCFIKQNWREIPEIIEFCNSQNVQINFNRVWHPPECSIWNSSFELLSEVLEFYKGIEFKSKTEISSNNINAFNELKTLLSSWVVDSSNKMTELKMKNIVDLPELENQIWKNIKQSLSDYDANQAQSCIEKLDRILIHFRTNPNFPKLIFEINAIPSALLCEELIKNTIDRLIILAENLIKES